jgi:hypothetical protein
MANTSFDLYGKSVLQLKSYLSGLGYNEGRDYSEVAYSRTVVASGKHEMAFLDKSASANAKLRWIALREKGFKEAS